MLCSMKVRNMIYALALMVGVVACTETPDVEIIPPVSEGRLTLEVTSESPLFELGEGGAEANVLFRSRGGEVVIDVLTNQASWSFEAVDAEWLTISSDDYFLTLAADRNTGTESRTATIVIRANRGEDNACVEVKVTQNHAGVPEIALASNVLRVEAHTSLCNTVEVESNFDEWGFDATCSWLLIEQSEEGLVLTADDNVNNALRETQIRVFAGEGKGQVEDVLTVRQDGNAFVILASHNIATDDEGDTKSLVVNSNPELEWGVTTDGSEWFSATKGEENTVVVAIDSNASGLERIGTFTINVGDENNSASATVKVHQIGSDTEELIYEVEITEPDFYLVAAPVLTTSSGGTITVDWGDGSNMETFESRRGSHTYATPGLYTISITGEAHQLEFGDGESYAPEVKNIISWGKLGVKNAADMCLGCNGLESIPNDVAGSFANVKSFLGAFSQCTSLKEIPAGLFRYATLAKNFEDCFSYTASITEIPEDLFANCVAAERFSYAFYGAGTGIVETTSTLPNFEEVKGLVEKGRLKSIPEGLFRNCSAVQKFDYAFGATAIESIPEGLFANNATATTFMGAFSACVGLTSIPEGLMKSATGATDIKYMFAGCDGVTEIPTGMFVNNSAVTNLEYIFYKTGVKKLLKGTFEGLSGVKTVGAVFQDCVALSEIEEGVFDGLTAAKSFKYCFSGCSSLKSIPEGLFKGLTTAYEFKSTFEATALESIPAGLFADARDYSMADLSYAFAWCDNLTTVPATLFEKFTTASSYLFQNTFYKSAIETIPAGLFAKNVKVSTGFESTFEGCTKLTTIEGSIFPETTTVSALEYTFAGCTALESLPEGLFDPLAGSQTKFTATFAQCTALATLPEGLFAQNTLAKSFTNTFNGCTALESLPANLMGSKEKVTSVKGIFENCSALTAIPADLFAGAPAITSFENAFANCSSLMSVPAELFVAIGTKTSSITFAGCFMKCSALESVPVSLFDTVRRINYIDDCFNGCSSLSGESPYTVIVAEDGSEQKVHLYERTRGTDFPTAPTSASAHTSCFAGCTNLSDYDNIPTDWK